MDASIVPVAIRAYITAADPEELANLIDYVNAELTARGRLLKRSDGRIDDRTSEPSGIVF